MPIDCSQKLSTRCRVPFAWLGSLFLALGLTAAGTLRLNAQAQTGPALPSAQTIQTSVPTAAPSTGSSFQGSVQAGQATDQTIDLTLDDAMQRGLKNNLGVILSGQQTAGARAQRLSALQALLPTIDANLKASVQQVDLAALGLRVPGFPTVVGPFGYEDLRAYFQWSLVDVKSLRSYMAEKHNFNAAQLTAEDARQMVILTVGNAYLVALADESQVQSVQAQVNTAKVALDQAVASHQAGTAPLIDELRARVAYQTLQQQLIVAQNRLDKDRIALARTIGLPLAQKFNLVDKAPYAAFDQVDLESTLKQAHLNRKDLLAQVEQTKAAEEQRKGATAERYPKVMTNVDYGLIGVNFGSSHGTIDATGAVSVPVFKEFGLRGEAEQAQAQLDTQRAHQSDANAQVDADVRDALLDIQAAQQQVEVARSSVDLANEALSQAQQRYVAGVDNNLAVTQAQQSVAQANDQLVSSLYRHNIAKLSLARALGAAENYKSYLGGK